LNAGDVFTIGGVNAVNPETLNSTGVLRNFVVTAAANSSAGGAAAISIFPPITLAPSPYQTVDAAPAPQSP
jgi:P22 coat protein - gene protein 5